MKWFVSGKHPMFADYFTIGDDTRLTMAFRKWVSSGYERFVNNKGQLKQDCSYRFWSKGDSDQSLVLGLLKSSTDSLGRPFPLLIIGTVHINDWQQRWPFLTRQLEPIWHMVDKKATDKYQTMQDIAKELAKIAPPDLSAGQRSQQYGKTLPNAVFTGGCGGKITSIRFSNPLTTQDFLKLWM
jgi:type VI secretion system protein VasJ